MSKIYRKITNLLFLFLTMFIVSTTIFVCFNFNVIADSKDDGYKNIIIDEHDYFCVDENNIKTECNAVKIETSMEKSLSIKSKFQFLKGVDNEKVFEVCFNSTQVNLEANNEYYSKWGFSFGLDSDNGSYISNNSFSVLFDRSTFALYKGNGSSVVPIKDNEGKDLELFPFYLDGRKFTVKVIGFSDGSLDLYLGYNEELGGVAYTKNINEVFCHYTGIKCDGYFGFGLWQTTGDESNLHRKLSINVMNVEGIVSVDSGRISYNKTALKYLSVGKTVALPFKFITIPSISGVSGDCSYEIMSGSNIASVKGGYLLTKGVGTVALKVISDYNVSVSEVFDIEIVDYQSYNYNLKEKFKGRDNLNEYTWSVYNKAENAQVTTNDKLFFVDSENSADGKTTKTVLDVPLKNNFDSGIVFDVTFTSYASNAKPDKVYIWGILFGMKSHSDDYDTENVGSLQIRNATASIYRGNKLVQPTYITEAKNSFEVYGTDNLCAYCDDTPLTIRLVAHTNGLLELYRGQSYYTYKDQAESNINNLYATYEGFDFNGYVSFFVNNNGYQVDEDHNSYSIIFQDVSLYGNYVIVDDICSIESVNIDEDCIATIFDTVIPVDIVCDIKSKPNIDYYHGFNLSVQSGKAYIDENNRLVTQGAEDIILRLTSTYNTTKYTDYNVKIRNLDIKNISINKERYKNLTTDSQPIDLIALVESNTSVEKYKAVNFEVISGNAEIVFRQLRITGAGEVELKVTSVYNPTKSTSFKFNVSDGDAQYNMTGGCRSLINSYRVSILISLSVISVVLYFVKKRSA